MLRYYHYWLPFFIAGAANLGVAAACLRKRRSRGALEMMALCLGAVFWSICEGLLYFGFDQQTNFRVTQIQYIGIVAVPPTMMFFIMALFGIKSREPMATKVLLCVPSMAMLALAWTNDFHWLVWSRVWTIKEGPLPMLGITHGTAYWVWLAYNYALLAAVTVILVVKARDAAGRLRAQAMTLLAAVLVVWLANAVYVSGLSPIPNMDITPLAFAVMAAIMALGLFRQGLLDLLPVAKEAVFRSLIDGVVVLDLDRRVIDVNPVAETIIGFSRSEAVGKTVTEVTPLDGGPKSDVPGVGDATREVNMTRGSQSGRVYDLRTSVLKDQQGNSLGFLQIWRDITKRKALEEELERLARTDSLTGVFNRRFFLSEARVAIRAAHRYNRPLSMLMIDLDHFKQVNDTYGHAAGDAVLTEMVAGCRKVLRETDLLGRMGGEEFAVMCLETETETAAKVAERLREWLANHSVTVTGKKDRLLHGQHRGGRPQRRPERPHRTPLPPRRQSPLSGQGRGPQPGGGVRPRGI
jgi:diguanylate cyclase (GGDEF)-like protein/PAS domain S-box-containing protein